MKINIQNRADLPNKYIRFIKWKLHRINKRFKDLIYFDVNLSKEGQSSPTYKATLKIGVPGHDIILTHQNKDLGALWKTTFSDVHRYINKRKRKEIKSLRAPK